MTPSARERVTFSTQEQADLIRTYLNTTIANLGYPVGMGLPPSSQTVAKMADDVIKLVLAALPAQGWRPRDERQADVAGWCADAFGKDQATSIPQRGTRMLEEAVEAYQAAGGSAEMAHRLIDYVFSQPSGALHQELGGLGLTLLALAQAAGLSADAAEVCEIARVKSKPLAHFAARNANKNALGFYALPEPPEGAEEEK